MAEFSIGGAKVECDFDANTDTYTVRYTTAGGTTLSQTFTAEELADMSYPGPHAYPSFPGSAYLMPLVRSHQTVDSGYQQANAQQWYTRQAEYERFMGGSLASQTQAPKPKPVPPSLTIQLHDSPNLKWLRGRVDEIRVPLENLS